MPSRRCPEEPSHPSGNQYRSPSGGTRPAPHSADSRKYGAWSRLLLQMRCVPALRLLAAGTECGQAPGTERGRASWPVPTHRLRPQGQLGEAAPTRTVRGAAWRRAGARSCGQRLEGASAGRGGHGAGDAGTARECSSTIPKMGVNCPKATQGDAQDLPGILSPGAPHPTSPARAELGRGARDMPRCQHSPIPHPAIALCGHRQEHCKTQGWARPEIPKPHK